MKITILDDYFDPLRTLPCFRTLTGHQVVVALSTYTTVGGLPEEMK